MSSIFQDNKQREWRVELNVEALRRVRSLVSVDLMQALDVKSGMLERLSSDPVLLVDVLFAMCEPQARENEISPEDFGRAMAGDAIEKAVEALLDQIVSFCPNPRDRAAMGRTLDAARKAEDQMREKRDELIQSGAIENAMSEAVEQMTADLASPKASGS